MKKTYIVIGLGRFGSAVAQRLYELGSEVLAIDLRPELVQKMESRVTCAAVCDARDEDALRTLGVRNYDCAIVAIGGDLATSVVATLNLKELGVQRVVCKATDETQRRALEKIGADHVVVPERGVRHQVGAVLDFVQYSGFYRTFAGLRHRRTANAVRMVRQEHPGVGYPVPNTASMLSLCGKTVRCMSQWTLTVR